MNNSQEGAWGVTPGGNLKKGKKRFYFKNEMEEFILPVEEVKFCQDSISCRFRDGKSLEETADEIAVGLYKPVIDVVVVDGEVLSLDNRRLFCCKITMEGSVRARLSVVNMYNRWKLTRVRNKEIVIRL